MGELGEFARAAFAYVRVGRVLHRLFNVRARHVAEGVEQRSPYVTFTSASPFTTSCGILKLICLGKRRGSPVAFPRPHVHAA